LHAAEHASLVALVLHGVGWTTRPASFLSYENFIFLPGCLVLVAVAGGHAPRWLSLCAWLSFLPNIVASALLVVAGKSLLEPRWFAVFCFTGMGALAWKAAPVVGLRWADKIGAFSYGLYAIHLPCLILADRWIHRPDSAVVTLVSIVIAWLAAIGLAMLLELCLQKWLNERWRPRPPFQSQPVDLGALSPP
jgi:hypothetical protein